MRLKKLINQNWSFVVTDETTTYDEALQLSTWETCHLPHGGPAQTVLSSGGRSFQGVLWYQKQLQLPTLEELETILIEFESIMQYSDVYIDGTLVSTHKCGYTPHIFEVTNIGAVGEILLVVRANNTNNGDIPPGKPQSGLDFNYYGGIYRDANLIVQPAIHFTNAILENKVAGGGIYISTLAANTESATLRIQSHIKSQFNSLLEITVVHSLQFEGAIVSTVTDMLDVVSEQESVIEMNVTTPELWDMYNPNLYNLVSEIYLDGILIDLIETEVGIRTIEMTYEEGFKINGNIEKVSGGNYHSAFTQLGNAMPANLQRRDIMKIREAGLTHIRVHYPYSTHIMSECNKQGVMVTVANPGWQYFQQGDFEQLAYQNLRTTIRWHRNNPSALIWEGNLNEATMTDEFMQMIQTIIHEELPFGDVYSGSLEAYSDVFYTGVDQDMIPNTIESKVDDTRPRWIREYGDSPDNWTDQNTVWRTPRKWGEDAMIKQVDRMIGTKYDWLTNYNDVYNAIHTCGFGMWPVMEYNRGYHFNPCYGGIFDLERIEKYSYNFFRSQRDSDEIYKGEEVGPYIYIANSFTEISPDNITVYSNCDEVSLYYNGNLVATQAPDLIAVKHPPFTFSNDFQIERNDSKLKAVGYIGGVIVTEVEQTVNAFGVPKRIVLTADDMGVEMIADGADTMFVRAEIVDILGNRVFNGSDEYPIKLEVNGEGYVFGDDLKYPALGLTGFLVKSTTTPGEINIKASLGIEQGYIANNILSDSLTLTTLDS